MPGTLYVVATPIGNLEDVTLRALRILREVSLVAAEDTRRTARLLQHYSISTPTTSLHEHNEFARAPHLVERLQAGESIAVVSDAGTPGISDPGARLVAAAHAAGITVLPVPGASAVTAAVSASGLGGDGFLFLGFSPARSSERKSWLQALANEPRAIVFYEAPTRVLASLTDIAGILGPRDVAVGRELTKIHETLVVRPIMAWIEEPPQAVGEFVLVVGPPSPAGDRRGTAPSAEQIVAEFGRMSNSGVANRREAIRSTAKSLGVPARDVFNAIEAQKKLG